MEAYSVLMSVYWKADPACFEAAVQSMLDQTVRTNDFVIVCDGALTEALEGVLKRFARQYPGLFHVVRLPENVGIGGASNAGLRVCQNELVAKMDADDLALPNRCALQLRRFSEKPALAVVGGQMEEFDDDPDRPYALRPVPETCEEIRRFARRRQPFNNQTVMFRRSAVNAVGGYGALRRNEDYDLYIRLLAAGYEAENLPATLVKARVDGEARRRRAGASTLAGCVRSRWRAYRMGFSSLWDFACCGAGQLFLTTCPPGLRDWIYLKFLRQPADGMECCADVQRT